MLKHRCLHSVWSFLMIPTLNTHKSMATVMGTCKFPTLFIMLLQLSSDLNEMTLNIEFQQLKDRYLSQSYLYSKWCLRQKQFKISGNVIYILGWSGSLVFILLPCLGHVSLVSLPHLRKVNSNAKNLKPL